MSIRKPKIQENNLWNKIRVIEFEEDKSEENRKKAFAKASYVLFDYRQEKNYPILDFFKVADPKNKNITICEFMISENLEFFVSRLFPQFNVKVNSKIIEPMVEHQLQLGDLVEVLDEKFLVHNQGDIPAEEAKRLKGLELVNKTVLGLKNQLQDKEKALTLLMSEIEVVQEQVNDLQGKINKRGTLREDLQNIINERKRLKEIFIMKRAEFEALYSMPLEDNLKKTEQLLSKKFSDQQNAQKDIARLHVDIERREKQLVEQNQMKKKMEVEKAKKEKEQLLKRIQELEKLEKMESSGDSNVESAVSNSDNQDLVLDNTGEVKIEFPSMPELSMDEDDDESGGSDKE